MAAEGRFAGRSPEIFLAVIGLLFSAVLILIISVFESPPVSAENPWPLIGDLFGVLFLAAAVLIWRGGQIGYLIAIPVSGIFLALFGPADLQDSLTGFADLGTFLQGLLVLTALVVSLVYSVLGWRQVSRRAVAPRQPAVLPVSASFALIAVGFLVGGTSIGVLASGVETRLLANPGTTANVTILRGAADPSNVHAFSPAAPSVKVGEAVTWVNKDTVAHTVTSEGNALFDSGNLPTGGTFRFTFTKAGTYHYFCTIHPWMKGVVVVAAS